MKRLLNILGFFKSTKGFLLTLFAGLIVGGFYFGISYMVEDSDYNFRVGTLLNEADSYLRSGLTKDAIAIYNELLREVKEQEQYATIKRNIGICYHRLSLEENKAKNLKKAILSYEEAIKIWEQSGINHAYAECYIYLGDAYWALSEVENKEDNLIESLKAYDEALQMYPENSYYYLKVESRREWVSDKLKEQNK
jgi:tetratricopeptide (TPR) repeat protein